MAWHAKYNCENCEFRVQQFDIEGDEHNVCIITNNLVGLLENCDKFTQKNGEHITK
jgi:hypothetical protein